MNNLIKHLGRSAAFLCVLLCWGCFQAENPFYRASDIVTDKRLEGRFVSATTNSNSTLSDSYVVKPAKNRHYNITYREGDKWAELDVVLFKCGTNLFLDLKKVADNGVNSEPAVGPSSGMEILHIATMADAHCVLRVRFVEYGIQSSGVLYGNPLYTVLQRHSNLKYKTSIQGQPIDPHIRIITNPTEELHALLLAEGSNDEVFGFKGTMFRRDTSTKETK
jgi:hypothetical protein